MMQTKDYIADISVQLIGKKGLDKVSVKDIVEACSMTRQTFYYHFDDIPDLLGYIVERKTQDLLAQARMDGNEDGVLHRFVELLDEEDDFVRKLLNSRYHDLVDQILFRFLYDFLSELFENSGAKSVSPKEWDFIVSYNAFAVKDILIYWRKNNRVDADAAIAMVRGFVTGRLSGR